MTHQQLVLAAANHASALIRTNSIESWGLAIWKAAKVYCSSNYSFNVFKREVSLSIRNRKNKDWRN